MATGGEAMRDAGIGLRAPHVAEICATRPPVGFLEVHAENYLGGGPAGRALEQLRRDYPLSVHAVGVSLGSADGLDRRHLARLAALVARLEPALVSEHLAWTGAGGAYLNSLLPLPYTEESLAVVARHVEQLQEALGRRVLIENPSSYLRFIESPIPEPEFLAALTRRTGCGLLLDVNNVYVSAHNLGFDPEAYLAAVPLEAVGELHLAGHARNDADGRVLLIDDHASAVPQVVWRLFAQTVRRIGPAPALVEWDTDVPPLEVLLGEARKATAILLEAGDAVAA